LTNYLEPIRAEIADSDRCAAEGLETRAISPVLAMLCQKLVAAGRDPATPLEAYRGDVLCLRVSSIGSAASATGPSYC
jgi:hypothetical protein